MDRYGPAWRGEQRAHLSLAQLKVMSALEQCRSATLGGHLLRCDGCGTDQIAYNSCRNRHCPNHPQPPPDLSRLSCSTILGWNSIFSYAIGLGAHDL